MKLTINIWIFFILIALTSCDNSLSRKKLNLKKIENEKVLIEYYRISEITSIHQFIDMTNKRWSKVERILEANEGSIDSVFIRQDTLFLRKTSDHPIIYDLAAIKFGYKIILLQPEKNDSIRH